MLNRRQRLPVTKNTRSLRALATVFLISALAPSHSLAADNDVGLWATGDYQRDIGPNWLASLAIQARFSGDIETLERLLFRPSLTYKTSRGIALTAGYDAHSIESPRDVIEHRSWQQIAVKHQIKQFTTFAHSRLEQRYFEHTDELSLRLRLNAGVDVPLTGGFSANFANEIFFTLNDADRGPRDGFDQNRLFAGIQKRLSEHLRVRLGYQMQYINRPANDDIAGHQVFVFLTYK